MNDPKLTAEAIEALNKGRKVEFLTDVNFPLYGHSDMERVGHLVAAGKLDSDHVRISPEPRFEPWTFEDVPVGTVIRRKDGLARLMITGAHQKGVYLGCPYEAEDDYHSFENLLTFWEQLDGSICGKAVQS